jgi:hypothetical protein
MKFSMGSTILAGGNSVGEQPYDLMINNSRQFQIATAMRADAVKNFDRGNQQTTVEFKVSKRHFTVEEALAYVLQLGTSLKDLPTTLTIVEEPSQDAYSLSDAVIVDVQSCSNGIVSSHSYRIIGGNFTKDGL